MKSLHSDQILITQQSIIRIVLFTSISFLISTALKLIICFY